MAHSNTILHQLLQLVPRHRFESLTKARGGDRYVKHFDTWSQFTTLLYAQAGGKTSLRDIEQGLATHGNRGYHLGLRGSVRRSTLADANAKRDWRIYEGLFYELLSRCRDLTPKHKFRFKNPLYSLDATVIDLCLNTFPWARFMARKGALRLHYQFDHSGHIPSFLIVTDGKMHEIVVAKESFPIIPDSITCFDKGYIDYGWLRRITDGGAYFVTRAKENLHASFLGQQERPRGKGVVYDWVVGKEVWQAGKAAYPYPLRLIGFWDEEGGRYLEFLTNNFKLSAATIARIYKSRWQIETFFKWIKQNLRIKAFLGTSPNAVMTQIWVAMCYYLLLAYVKYQARYSRSLFYLHRIVKETLLERASLFDLLRLNDARLRHLKGYDPQLCLQL